MASAKALAALSPTLKDGNADLLPPIADARKVGLLIGEAVGKQAIADGVAGITDSKHFEDTLRAYVWESVYLPYERQEQNPPFAHSTAPRSVNSCGDSP